MTAADPGLSGINLSRPSDSGINLQMAAGLGLGQARLDRAGPAQRRRDQDGRQAAAGPSRRGQAKSLAGHARRPAVDKGEKDIFDDTDFEVDALASDERLRRQDDAARGRQRLRARGERHRLRGLRHRRGGRRPERRDRDRLGRLAEDEDEEDDGFEAATSGEMAASAWDVESETPSAPPAAPRPAAVLTAAGASAEWGGLWVGMLGVATVLMLFLSFVSMDLVRNLYDFRNDTPASGLVKSIAGLIVMKD